MIWCSEAVLIQIDETRAPAGEHVGDLLGHRDRAEAIDHRHADRLALEVATVDADDRDHGEHGRRAQQEGRRGPSRRRCRAARCR